MTRRADAGKKAPRKRRIPGWLEVILLAVVALLVSLVAKTFLVQMFFVPSGSMEPLFVTDDRILVEKISSWDGQVERGDVVVFEDPGGWLPPQPELNGVQKALSTIGLYPTGGHLVKRVVGVGGDHVVCCDDQDRVTVNDVPLDEPYLQEPDQPQRAFDVTVPEGRLWVMGDNRSNSEDSRFHQDLPGKGAIPEGTVVGRVWAIAWPLSRFEVLDRPSTYDQVLDPPD